MTGPDGDMTLIEHLATVIRLTEASDHDRRVIDVPDWLMLRETWRETFKEEW